jgi:hypothetical protein
MRQLPAGRECDNGTEQDDDAPQPRRMPSAHMQERGGSALGSSRQDA